MKSGSTKKVASPKKAALEHVVKDTEKIKQTVQRAAGELTSVNKVLKQEEVPVQSLKQAVAKNEGTELKVAKAAQDLKEVSSKLSREVAERKVIESELADTKSDLAEVRHDLTQAHEQAKEAQELAFQDVLTGLPNRALFEQGLEHGLSQARRHGWGLAVLFIDLDKFKSINDAHGHDLGDQVLLMVASRLKSFIRKEDMVSRWGGDEFVCLCLEVQEAADISRLAEKMVARIADPCEFDGKVLSIEASIGIALYPTDGESAEALFKNADAAMYRAKAGQERVVWFRTA